MRVAINTLAVTDDNEGIRTMLIGLVEALVRIDDTSQYRLICSCANKRLFAPIAASSSGRAELVELARTPRSVIGRILADQLTVPRLVRRDVDILVSPASIGTLFSGVRQVVVVQHHLSLRSVRTEAGLERLSLIRRLYFGPVMRLSHRRAAAVTAVSADLAARLIAETGVAAQKVVPILNGIDPKAPVGDTAAVAPHQYALFVSTLYPYKNASAVIRAFAAARERLPKEFRTIIVGRDPDGQQVPALTQLARDLGVDSVVDIVGKVDDRKLMDLYAGAAAFVFPSYAEGFGIPALEAMASGVPVVVSNRTALPEVVNGAGLLVDPGRPKEIANALVRVVEDAALRRRLVAAGRARAAELTWDRSAREFVKVFGRLAD